jgi:hypothetical protein
MVLEKARKIRKMDDIRKSRQENIDYILETRQELVENFPNKWVSVNNGMVELVDDELFILYKLVSGREEGNESRIFYLSNLFDPALILIRPVEVEYDSSKT